MSKDFRLRVYEPPLVKDISGIVTKGQDGPMGLCMSGSNPFQDTCADGTDPTQDPGLCSPNGVDPSIGGCAGGTGPAQYCGTGSIASS
jgi:hypothetical protein